MKALGRRFGRLLAWPLVGLLAVYRYVFSPLLGSNCRFQPSCSEYAREAVLRHGAFRGGWLAARRVARCHPWGGSGHDPLPEQQERRNGRWPALRRAEGAMTQPGVGAQLLRELRFPLSDTVVLIAIVCFTLLTLLAREAGILGVWLGVILVPALWRYLLMLLEARAHGRSAPVAGIETFNPIDNFWSLTPLVLVALSIWGSILLHRQVSPLAGQAFALALIAVLPASAAVLALTRSPSESLDPRAIVRMMVACGPAYVLPPASLLLSGTIIGVLEAVGAPAIVIVAATYYSTFLVFTLTGSLLFERQVQLSISIPEPVAPDENVAGDRRQQGRRGVLTHAYGFFARDNRAGAMAHLEDALQGESNDDEAWRWYLGEMFSWESKDGALMLAQRYLHRLLQEERDVEAVKLMSRCLLEDPRFRPLAGDRDAARELVERMHRSDLMRALDLRGKPTAST